MNLKKELETDAYLLGYFMTYGFYAVKNSLKKLARKGGSVDHDYL